jgi:phosphoglycerate kinase
VAVRLGELLGTPVAFATDVTGPSAQAVVAGLGDGDVALLQNVRYDARETSKDPAERGALAAELASLADAFVSEGFGVVHREQASVTDVARLLPHAAGQLVLSEVQVFRKVLGDPDRPYAVVLGGSKVSDKLGVINNLLQSVDRLLVGGGMCFTFLAAQGHGVGSSLLEADQIDTVKGLIATAAEKGVELVLPVDVVVATAFSADAEHKVVAADAIEDGWMGLDIGPKSRELFAAALADAKTVVWNGPMGVFEMAPYAEGTRAVAEAITHVDGLSVVGGGDSAAAVRLLGIDEAGFSHISTGGGASLEFLEGRVLPGIAVLED